jgi:hypothetical protein
MRGVQERISCIKCDHIPFEFYDIFSGCISYLLFYDFVLQFHDQTKKVLEI